MKEHTYRKYSEKFNDFLKEVERFGEVDRIEFYAYTVGFMKDIAEEKAKEEEAAKSEGKRVLIGIPNMGSIKSKTVASLLAMDKTEDTGYCMICSSLIYDARDMIVGEALNDNYDYLLFVDSDIEFEKDALLRLINRDLDIVTAIYYIYEFYRKFKFLLHR